MIKKKLKQIPKFKDKDEVRDFWSTANSLEYFDMENAVHISFPNLKPSTKPITIRMPNSLVNKIKLAANERDVPYQSLIKVWLADRVAEEFPKYISRKRSTKIKQKTTD